MRTKHIIKQGETLQRISCLHYGTFELWIFIYNVNREIIGNGPDTLQSGAELDILEPKTDEETYTALGGDNYRTIAQAKYGDERLWRRISQANENVQILPGDKITIPALADKKRYELAQIKLKEREAAA